MTRSYKWLGGIGYILMLIPFANIVGFILVGIAWIMSGSDTRQGIFKATGILMLITMILTVVIIVSWFPIIGSLIAGLPLAEYPSVPPPGFFREFLRTIGLFLILVGITAVLAIVEWILELVSHFRAATVYNVKWFRRAGWMRIVTIIVAIIVIALFILSALSIGLSPAFFTTPSEILNLISLYMVGLIIPGILGLLSLIFSAISFFSIPEAAVERRPPYLPPPPE
ncbi:MAG: hypothetical protein LZ172_02455 [Thaumarchaeota archaeon]|jgi:uncharacterized membrane protein|nr:hypothetical protein [Candidatus Geocrenenecus arthurdayi]MCL7390973.1 hypothetical protein [Candidatus Geocrenenecus arthurdayi]MCL7396160.1 hypothetical protein [Candidatus Geocrenenecus arthurdayi]MCL7403197.1 hypothetical protein [Candidatus Geocrenenecus arthurdayi]